MMDEILLSAEDGGASVTLMDTLYNGRCSVVKSNINVTKATYVKLSIRGPPRKLQLFLLHPGEELFVIFQNWGFSSLLTMQVDGHALVPMYSHRYYYLMDPDGLNCLGDGSGPHMECIRGKVGERLAAQSEEEGWECMPSQVEPFVVEEFKVGRYFY